MNTDKHAEIPCPRCKTNQHTFLDEHHTEIYCDKCGLVIQDNSINTVTDNIRLQEYQEKKIYKLHHRRMG